MNDTWRIVGGDFRPAALVPKLAPIVVHHWPVDQPAAGPSLHVLILSKRELIIGRDNTCDHSLISVEVSRRHARITFEDGLWYIHDLGSTNGLYVQGSKLACGEKVVLEDQFDVYFGPPDKGHFKYTFHAHFDPATVQSVDAAVQPAAASLPSPDYLDSSSGYESVSTQDYNSGCSTPMATEPEWKAEIHRLKVENCELETALKQEQDNSRKVWGDLRQVHQTLQEKEAQFKADLRECKKKHKESKKGNKKLNLNLNFNLKKKKKANVDGLIKKCKTLSMTDTLVKQ